MSGHIVIAGTGRSGTTLLVRILQAAEVDTGFSKADIEETETHVARAGLEVGRIAPDADLPQVLKLPHFAKAARRGLREGWLDVALLLVPIRDIDAVVKSRKSVSLRSIGEYFSKGYFRGGIVGGPKWFLLQKPIMLRQFFDTLQIAAQHEIPVLLMDFPRLARDEDYLVRMLLPPLSDICGMTEERLRAAFRSEAKPDLIRS